MAEKTRRNRKIAAEKVAIANSSSVADKEARWVTAVSVCCCIAILAAAFLIDPQADLAFDAPKWLIAGLCGLAIVTILLLRLWQQSVIAVVRAFTAADATVVMLILAIIGAIVSTSVAIHGPVAWRALLKCMLLVPFVVAGASLPLNGPAVRRLGLVALIAASGTMLLSLLQFVGFRLPLHIDQIGGRYATGALLGNEGYVALVAALTGAAGFAWLTSAWPNRRFMAWPVSLLLLSCATIAMNRQLTAALALLTAAATILALRWNAHKLVLVVACAALLASTTALVPALRSVTWGAIPGMDASAYQRVTTYRLGAWAAAEEMVRHHPWLGSGPGSFAVESTTRRLDAEIRYGTRLLQPTGATFVAAHQDWLQLAAEAGVPVAALVFIAYVTLLWRLMSPLRQDTRHNLQRIGTAAVLVAAGVAALGWFPMQIPLIALVVAFAAGRGWRLALPGRTQR